MGSLGVDVAHETVDEDEAGVSVQTVDEGVDLLRLDMNEVHVESMSHCYNQYQTDDQVILTDIGLSGPKDELRLHDEDHSCEADNCKEEVYFFEGFLSQGIFALYAIISMKKLKMGAMLKTVVEVLTGMYLTQKNKRV